MIPKNQEARSKSSSGFGEPQLIDWTRQAPSAQLDSTTAARLRSGGAFAHHCCRMVNQQSGRTGARGPDSGGRLAGLSTRSVGVAVCVGILLGGAGHGLLHCWRRCMTCASRRFGCVVKLVLYRVYSVCFLRTALVACARKCRRWHKSRKRNIRLHRWFRTWAG